MREGDGGLNQLFDLLHPKLVEHQGQADLTGHGDGDAAQAEDDGVAQGAHQLLVPEHLFKIGQAHPFAAPDAQLDAVLLKCQNQAAHGCVTEDQIPCQHRQQQHIQQPVVFQPGENLVTPSVLGVRQPLGGRGGCFLHCSLLLSVISLRVGEIIPSCRLRNNVFCALYSQLFHVFFNTVLSLFPYIVVLTIFHLGKNRFFMRFLHFPVAPQGFIW